MRLLKDLGMILSVTLILAGCTTSFPPPPSQNSAVVSLLEQAQSLSAAGQLDQAGASLERALRIEPRNPLLWQRLAAVRIDQQQYLQAENLAKKSNALAQGDHNLRRENWLLIARARSLNGDDEGSREARERAGQE